MAQRKRSRDNTVVASGTRREELEIGFFAMKRAMKKASMVKWIDVVASDNSTSTHKKRAYSKLAKFHSKEENNFLEAFLFAQLSTQLLPAKEALARAVLRGTATEQLVSAAMYEDFDYRLFGQSPESPPRSSSIPSSPKVLVPNRDLRSDFFP
jgi:hypothetical protein